MKYTYEEKTTDKELELYEWDDIWWDHANDSNLPRMLIVGDSISCGYRRIVAQKLLEQIHVDGIGTSKAVDNEHYFALISYVLRQQPYGEIIQFNNGLHGWHLDIEQYRFYYAKTVDYIMQEYGRKVILATTTPVRDKNDLSQFAARNDIVLARNQAMHEIAEERGLIVNDLYSAVAEKPQLWQADGVHLKEEGYQLLAQQTVDNITKVYQG